MTLEDLPNFTNDLRTHEEPARAGPARTTAVNGSG